MAQLTVNGIDVAIKPPLVGDEVLENAQRVETGDVRVSRHGGKLRALDVVVETDFLTDAEKEALEAELLAPGPATIGGDLFGSGVSAHLVPEGAVPGPLSDMWTLTFRVRGVGT